MIKNLIFDFGKVLVDYDFEAFFVRHIPDDDRRRAFGRLLNTAEMVAAFDRELIPVDQIIGGLIASNPQFERELTIFRDRYADIITGEVPGMRQLLTRLKAQGYRLYGLTNWCSKVHDTIARYPIFGLLDGRVISSEEHLIKPEPEIYRCLLDRYGLKAQECVFTDDRAENVEAGRREGIRGIVFSSAEQYEAELMQLLHQ